MRIQFKKTFLILLAFSVLAPETSFSNKRECKSVVDSTSVTAEVRLLTQAEIPQALAVFRNTTVRDMSHDDIQEDNLIYSLSNPKEALYGIWSGDKMAGVVQSYNYPPGISKFPKYQEILRSFPERPKVVGLGLHLLPNYFGKGFSNLAFEKVLEITFADPTVAFVWAAVHRENTRSHAFCLKNFSRLLVRAGEHNDYDYFIMTFQDYRNRAKP